jgi:hypothetical protein
MPEFDAVEARVQALNEADLQAGLDTFRGKLREAEAFALNACVHCGLCAGQLPLLPDGARSLENIPARKLDLIAQVFQPALHGPWAASASRARPWTGIPWPRPGWTRCTAAAPSAAAAPSTAPSASPCPRIFRAARARPRGHGPRAPGPPGHRGQLPACHGNNMAITREDWVETVEWLEEELQAETGDPGGQDPPGQAGRPKSSSP